MIYIYGFKNGTNLNRMENWAVKRKFLSHISKIATCTKKVDMLNPVNSDWG